MALNLTGMDPDALEDLLLTAQQEQNKRSSRQLTESRMDEVLMDRLNTDGVPIGAPWQEPDGTSSAYPRGFIVGWGEGFRRSIASVNTERPDVLTHWETVTVDPPAHAGGGPDAA